MSAEKSEELGLKPLAKVWHPCCRGEPRLMGWGPVPATHKALKRAGLNINDIGLVETERSLCRPVLAVMKELLEPGDHECQRGCHRPGASVAAGWRAS